MGKNRRVFLFAYAFPPYKAIGSIRLHSIARCLEKNGFNVSVFTTTNSLISPQEKFNLERLNVYKILTIDYKSIQFLLNKFKKRKTKIEIKSNKSGNVKKLTFLSYLTSFPFNILFGMGGVIYMFFTFLISFFKIKKGDIVFSSYSPYADHIICFCHKILRPSLVWICDFRDLHITPGDEDQIKFLRLNQIINRAIIRRADYVTTVSIGLLMELSKFSDSAFLLKNAIHPDIASEYNDYHLRLHNAQPKFEISYTGGLYSGRRDPSILFEAIKLLIEDGSVDKSKLSIVYAGSDSTIWLDELVKFGLSDIGITHGMVPLKKSIEIQCKSSVNLLLTWATDEQKGILTGKFYEYLLAKRPIFNIINGVHDSEIELLFDNLGAGEVFYTNDTKTSIMSTFKSYYDEWLRSNFTQSRVSQEELDRNIWDDRIHDLLRVINE